MILSRTLCFARAVRADPVDILSSMNVVFNEEQAYGRTVARTPRGLFALVIGWGLAKDEKSATTVLLILFGITLILAVGVIVLASPSKQAVSPEKYADPARVTIPPPRTP